MVCYYHPERAAVGICKHCGRGLCVECAALVEDTLACRDRHEDQVRGLNLTAERALQQAGRVGSGYVRNAVFYGLVGLLFTGFGLMQYRFLGLQAVFFMLIGVFLLYAAVANYLESRKFR
jgi:sulfite exporter TauE/SafE